MSTPTPEAPLSPHWAFVVQLREGTALTPQGVRGRVEHIVSGQATLFASLAELWAFMQQVLTPRGTDPMATAPSTTAAEAAPDT
ncbi:MAG TPA: hypothetical protein VLK82_18440 [Candidatus Tectomicrobia bacterium]|nr:hypothetical protein [Candidatus Tectomicrobia bacterium]